MEYSEAMKKDIWEGERRAADAILKHCQLLKLPIKLDSLTLGVGNCFMVAVLQQLRRPELHNNLSDELKQMSVGLDQMKLRRFVVTFISQKQDNPQIIYMKERFAPDPELINGPKSWEEYWEKMLHDCNWADGDFVQATAWFLKHDLWIVDTSCTEQHPFIKVNGNFNNADSLEINVEPLLLGTTTGSHYQSLMFDQELINKQFGSLNYTMRQHLKRKLQPSTEIGEPSMKTQKVDTKISYKPSNKCPNCRKEFQQLLRHIKQSKCHASLKPEFIQQIENKANDERRLKQQMRSAENRKRKRIDNPEEMKRKHNQTVAAYRDRKRIEDHEAVKRQHNQTVATYRDRKRTVDFPAPAPPCTMSKGASGNHQAFGFLTSAPQ